MSLTYVSKDFNHIPVKNFVLERGTSAPASPVTDQLWVDTSGTPHLLKMYDGSTWTAVGYIADGSITDAQIAANAAIALSKLATNPLARANHTGTQASSTISDLAATVQGYSLDLFAAAADDVDLGGNQLVNVGDPTDPMAAVNLRTLDEARMGFQGTKDPVRVVAAAGYNVASPGATIDGVTMAQDDRFLVPDGGLYVYNGAGNAADVAPDADDAGEVADGTTVAVSEGTHAGEIWIQRATEGSTPDWGQFLLGGVTYSASAPVTLTGSTFGLATVPVASGGTGATTAAGARANLAAASAYGETIDGGTISAGNPAMVTHNLNSAYIFVGVKDAATGQRVEVNWTATSNNAVEISADVAIAGDLDVAVFGV